MSNNKVSPNDPCWCGSGRKYKKCHSVPKKLNSTASDGSAINLQNVMWSRSYCMYPMKGTSQCSDTVIDAHSIQRKGNGLEAIAENEKVLSYSKDLRAVIAKREPPVSPVHISKASTFRGFCDRHDQELFRRIETEEVIPDDEQAFLAGYRALMWTNYVATGEYEQRQQLNPEAMLIDPNRIEMKHKLKAAESALSNRAFDDYEYLAVVFDTQPPLMLCASKYPDFDFSGNFIQKINESGRCIINVSYTPRSSGGVYIFSWNRSEEKSREFAKSLIAQDDEYVADAIIKYAMASSDNVYWSKSWWSGLKKQDQRFLTKPLKDAYVEKVDQNYLVDDGRRLAGVSPARLVYHIESSREAIDLPR